MDQGKSVFLVAAVGSLVFIACVSIAQAGPTASQQNPCQNYRCEPNDLPLGGLNSCAEYHTTYPGGYNHLGRYVECGPCSVCVRCVDPTKTAPHCSY